MKVLTINKNNIFVVALIAIAVVTHWRWFFSSSILTHNDWWFNYTESLKSYLTVPYAWFFEGLGSVNLNASSHCLFFFQSLLTSIGLSYGVMERLMFMFPAAILIELGSFIFLKKLFNSNWGALVGSLVFSFNSYVLLLEGSHLNIINSISIAPLVLYLYLNNFQKKQLRLSVVSSLCLWLMSIYEFRMFYIFSFILVSFSLYYIFIIEKFNSIKVLSKNLLLSFSPLLIAAALNCYWFLGLMKMGSITNNELFSRGLFGNGFLNIIRSSTLFQPFWTGSEPTIFIVQPVPLLFFAIPIFAFLGFYLNKKNHYVVFFSLMSIVGVLLAKQAGEPFSDIYLWLYNNFPGFNAFREATKFYFITALGYSVLICSFVTYLWRHSNSKVFNLSASFIIAFLFLWNAKPLINGELGQLFVSRNIPNDYLVLKDKISNENNYFRTYWLPVTSRWSFYSSSNPRISGNSISSENWKNIYAPKESEKLVQNKIVHSLQLPYSKTLMDYMSVKYLVVPLQDIANDDDFYIYYGKDENPDIRNWYISELDKLSYIRKIDIGTRNLAVYENQDYKPYIFALNEVNGLESFDKLDNKYDFLTSEIKSEFAFYDLDKRVLPSRKLYVPFESITFSNIANDKINSTIVDNNDTSNVYVNTGKKSVIIRYIADKIEVSKKHKNNINFNGASTNLDSAPEILYASKAGSTNYYAEIGSRLINIAAEKKETDLGVVTEPFELFALSKNNAIQNASFEVGKWSEDVGDCNANDSNSILGMEVSNDASEGGTSVQLDATSHIACTGQNDILADGGQDYLFGFDYQSPNAKNAGFYIEFNDVSKTVISERLPVSNADWNTFQKKIDIPTGATKMNLVIYSYSSDNKTKITTKYDNFKLFALEKVTTIDPKYAPRFEKINIPTKNEYKIEYSDPNENFNNLIKNPSLEDGLWSEQVGDCNNYDSDGQLSMSQSTEQKTNGNYSLQLDATRHIACTGAGLMPVIENRTYLFSFDYQSPNGKEAGYYLGFNDPEKTVISEHLPIKNTGWNNFTKQIKAPTGASAVSLIVYAYADDGNKEIINRYDNFSFIGLPDLEDRYFFVTEPKEKLNNPASVDFELINPTKKKVHIKGATTPFYLSMSESYHPQWQAQMNNQKIQGFFSKWVPWAKPDRIKDDKHFELEGFLNGWYVDTEKLCANNYACTRNADGSYDMEMVIEFFPQRWFYLGLLISGTTLLGCIGYLGYDWRRRRKKRVKSNNSSGFPPARE